MTKKNKTMWVFVFQKYDKFGSISFEHFKPLISEVSFFSKKTVCMGD